MPTIGRAILADMRSAGLTVEIGPLSLIADPPGTVPRWRSTFTVTPRRQITDAQRATLRAYKGSVRVALELERLDAVHGADRGPDHMFAQWLEAVRGRDEPAPGRAEN
jgi:hypothetical protein